MVDSATRHEIDKVVKKTLKEAGMKNPPFLIQDLLEHLEIDREFYDLEDPGLMRRFIHKVKVKGQILSKITKKIKLAAMWLPNTGRKDKIYVDTSLPEPKKKWASFHDASHSILSGIAPIFLETLHRPWTLIFKMCWSLRPIMVHLVSCLAVIFLPGMLLI